MEFHLNLSLRIINHPGFKVQIAVKKADLLGTIPHKQENELSFTVYPNLGAFRFFLDIICQEMTKYELWPVRGRSSVYRPLGLLINLQIP